MTVRSVKEINKEIHEVEKKIKDRAFLLKDKENYVVYFEYTDGVDFDDLCSGEEICKKMEAFEDGHSKGQLRVFVKPTCDYSRAVEFTPEMYSKLLTVRNSIWWNEVSDLTKLKQERKKARDIAGKKKEIEALENNSPKTIGELTEEQTNIC